VDAEGGFGLGELDIGFPELLVAPVGDVGAPDITALGEGCPIVEGRAANELQKEAGRTIRRL